MILGEVNPNGEAIVRLRVYGTDGTEALIYAGVDTGFTEALCLNSETIETLRLPFLYRTEVQLGNGSFARMNVYTGNVDWDDRSRRVRVHATDGDALIGVELLRGYHVGIDMVDGGRVSIEQLV